MERLLGMATAPFLLANFFVGYVKILPITRLCELSHVDR
jgi:hypothetical protein